MTDSIRKSQHPCWAEFKCHYKVGDTCTFWDQVGAMLSVLQEKHHKNGSCILDLIDTYPEPCLDQDEEGRKRGIGNLFADKGAVH